MSQQDQLKNDPASVRCPGPSTRDIILRDDENPPEWLITEAPKYMGDDDLPYDSYTSQEFFRDELEHMWTKVWQWACREEHIPEPGDHVVYDVGYHSILVTRTEAGEIKAYYNSCMHRGTQLLPSEAMGSVAQFRCPYHGWTWNLDGTIKDIPCRWDFPKVTDENVKLQEVRCETWGGFVFINMDPDAIPLEEYLEVVPDHFSGRSDMNDRHIVLHTEKILPCNWKAGQEAFLEAYHILETHWQAADFAGDANTQYDVFGKHVTRFVQLLGYQSPHRKERFTEQELLDAMRYTPEGTKVPEGETARTVTADFLRKSLGAQMNKDLSEFSTSEMVDSIEYHVFPNMFMFPGVNLPMVYRFRPNGTNVNECIFDLIFMAPNPEGKEPPPPPMPIKVGIDESYTTVPGMDPGLGAVFDQDTGNLAMQQKGFMASRNKRGQTLGNYQESRTRNIHNTLMEYVNSAK